MKLYRFPDNKIWKIAFQAYLFVLLLLARDTLITTCLVGFYPSQLTVAGLMVALGIVFLVCNRRQWREIFRDKRMIVLTASAVLILLPLVCKLDVQLMYFSVLLCIFFGVFLTYFTTLKEVAKLYVVMMTVLAAYSVFAVYIGRIPADAGIVAMPTFVNAGERDFYNFLLSFVSISQVKFRNFGIFREPGVYQFFLITALILHNYTIQWDKAWKYWAINIILALTVLTTFSTNGVAEAGLLVLVVFFDKKLYQDRKIRIAAIVLVILAVAGITAILIRGGDLAFTLMQMVTKVFTRNNSSSARLDAIVSDVGFFLQNPLFGEKIAVVLGSVEHNTTSTMLMFAMFGIGGGALHLASWLALVWDRQRKVWVNIALVLIVLMSFNTQNIIADVFFWLFPMMALTERVVPFLISKARK